MTRHAYIAVEGPHDVAFVAELLRPLGILRVQKKAALDPYWERLVPTTFPHKDDLLARVPVPLFLHGAGCAVAVHGVSGVTELVRRTEESLALVDGERPAVAAILDADTSPGTLETLLEECAKERYPQLMELATSYIDGVDKTTLSNNDLKDFQKPAGRQKALVSVIAGVLRPTKALQVTIQDNEWLRGSALELPQVLAVRRFLADLLALSL